MGLYPGVETPVTSDEADVLDTEANSEPIDFRLKLRIRHTQVVVCGLELKAGYFGTRAFNLSKPLRPLNFLVPSVGIIHNFQ